MGLGHEVGVGVVGEGGGSAVMQKRISLFPNSDLDNNMACFDPASSYVLFIRTVYWVVWKSFQAPAMI